ncbi:MAG: hypothetical protein ACR2J5_03325 [Geodermatophilaceae bacterium]
MSAPGMPRMLIVCNSKTHQGRIARLARFRRQPAPYWWREEPRKFLVDSSVTGVNLQGDTPVEEPNDLPDGTVCRTRYRFECGLCGDSLEVVHESLYPKLSAAEDAGASQISIALLRATLT